MLVYCFSRLRAYSSTMVLRCLLVSARALRGYETSAGLQVGSVKESMLKRISGGSVSNWGAILMLSRAWSVEDG